MSYAECLMVELRHFHSYSVAFTYLFCINKGLGLNSIIYGRTSSSIFDLRRICCLFLNLHIIKYKLHFIVQFLLSIIKFIM